MQVLDSVDTNGHQEEHQNELSVGQRAAHEIEYPFIQEFSELLSDLSTKELLKLLTNQQKNLAKAFWEAENYGGCREKCKKKACRNPWERLDEGCEVPRAFPSHRGLLHLRSPPRPQTSMGQTQKDSYAKSSQRS